MVDELESMTMLCSSPSIDSELNFWLVNPPPPSAWIRTILEPVS